jgi:hypothetical protein
MTDQLHGGKKRNHIQEALRVARNAAEEVRPGPEAEKNTSP